MEAKDVEDTESNFRWCWFLLVSVIAILVIVAGVLAILEDLKDSKKDSASHHPGPVEKKYADALEIALQFFDGQKCKSLPIRITSSAIDFVTGEIISGKKKRKLN
jgi:hypothetical protein